MARVTVVVPNFNHAAFLTQRLETILNQSYQDFEVVLLDDGSTDDSRRILRLYSALDSRVKALICNPTNGGVPFRQWRRGVELAEGEYVWIAESDDYSSSLLLERLVAALDANPRVGLAYCQSAAVDHVGNTLYSLKEWTDDLDAERWARDYVSSGVEECRRFLTLKTTIPNASAVVFRRAVYESVGGADDSFRLAGDWMLWAKLLVASDVAFHSESLNYFRTHVQTVRRSRHLQRVREVLRIFEFIDSTVGVDDDIRLTASESWLNLWLQDCGFRPGRLLESAITLSMIARLSPGAPYRLFRRAVRRLGTTR